MSRAVGFVVMGLATVGLSACTTAGAHDTSLATPQAAPSTAARQPASPAARPGQPSRGNAELTRGDFALQVSVRAKDVSARRLHGATVRLPGSGIEAVTDVAGLTGPLRVPLSSRERFPYEVHVSMAGFNTCVIRFGSMVFPGNPGWSQSTEAHPYQLFVYMPAGDGIATGDECYGGRTKPQTPGPNK